MLALLVPSAPLGAQTAISSMCALAAPVDGQPTTLTFPLPDGRQARLNLVAQGVPAFRVTTTASGESERVRLSPAEAAESATCIVEAQGRYYWLTREMTEMARSESGVFVTYHALNGIGYVRMTDGSPRNNPFLQEMVGARYIEHMMTGFSTITYIGLW